MGKSFRFIRPSSYPIRMTCHAPLGASGPKTCRNNICPFGKYNKRCVQTRLRLVLTDRNHNPERYTNLTATSIIIIW